MTEHSVPRRTVIGGGLGLGAGLATGVVQAQAPRRVQAPAQAPAKTQQQSAASGNPAIGYLTSMTYDGPLRDSFWQGLRDNGWEGDPAATPGAGNQRVDIVPGAANGAYDDSDTKQNLNGYVDGFNTNNNVKLIVAVGGLAPAYAAQKKSRKPYLVVIGQLPNDFDVNGANFFGGVNLETPAGNPVRNAYLATTHSIKPNEICLMYNKNSRMSQPERRAWRAHRWPDVQGGAGANGDNDTAQFARAFMAAKTVAKGVVISADPYFGYHRNDLVSAASTAQLYVCYPFQYFGGASPKPDPNRSSWYGPDINGAYYAVGVKAAKLLTVIVGGGAPTFLELDTGAMAGPSNFPP